MPPSDLLRRIRDNCAGILNGGRDALVPIILDGENAWEYYDRNGRPFFRELYRRISADPHMECVTVSEAFERLAPPTVDHIFPGSWINSNFDVWIGADEDNRAWEYLLAARQAYRRRRRKKYRMTAAGWRIEELLIAEGSDWCWWYGPEHDTANRVEFDELYRGHLANVYAALNLTAPEELSRPIIHVREDSVITQPTGPHHAQDRRAGVLLFRVDGRRPLHVARQGGAMHGKRFIFSQIQFGATARSLSSASISRPAPTTF